MDIQKEVGEWLAMWRELFFTFAGAFIVWLGTAIKSRIHSDSVKEERRAAKTEAALRDLDRSLGVLRSCVANTSIRVHVREVEKEKPISVNPPGAREQFMNQCGEVYGEWNRWRLDLGEDIGPLMERVWESGKAYYGGLLAHYNTLRLRGREEASSEEIEETLQNLRRDVEVSIDLARLEIEKKWNS